MKDKVAMNLKIFVNGKISAFSGCSHRNPLFEACHWKIYVSKGHLTLGLHPTPKREHAKWKGGGGLSAKGKRWNGPEPWSWQSEAAKDRILTMLEIYDDHLAVWQLRHAAAHGEPTEMQHSRTRMKSRVLRIHTHLKLPLFDKSASFPLSVYTHKPHDIVISVRCYKRRWWMRYATRANDV